VSELQIYVLTYEETLHIAERKGWTRTRSWLIEGYYYTTKPDKTLQQYLEPYKMTPEKWRRLLGDF